MTELLVANPLLSIMLVLALGAAVGQIPFGPLRFGAAGALFVGLGVGALDPEIGTGLGLVQTLGLTLFVYTVGIAAGSTFFADLRRQLPLMGLGIGVLAVITAVAVGVGAALGLNPAHIAGVFAGALTSTPALAAATDATGSPDAAVGYSIGYPIGVTLAIIAVAAVVARSWPGGRDTASLSSASIETATSRVQRETRVCEVPGHQQGRVVLSSLRRDGRTTVVSPQDVLLPGDDVVVTGADPDLQAAVAHLGHPLDTKIHHDHTTAALRPFLVSNPDLIGRTVSELDFGRRFQGAVLQVRRGDLQMLASDDLVLQPGDRVLAVVPRESLDEVDDFVGNSERRISEVDSLAAGIGVSAGLLLGTVAVPLPGGIEFALGSAAGPLVVGMVLGGLHRTGPLIWDLPLAANLTIRQLGLLLFLATVGLASGPAFASEALTFTGLSLGVVAMTVTLVAATLFLGGARWLGLSAPRGAGGFAGFIGQPAILAYATGKVNDERIEAGYAALFALAIIVKILAVQVIAVT